MSDLVARDRAGLERRHGHEVVDRFDLRHLADLHELGYHVFMAERGRAGGVPASR